MIYLATGLFDSADVATRAFPSDYAFYIDTRCSSSYNPASNPNLITDLAYGVTGSVNATWDNAGAQLNFTSSNYILFSSQSFLNELSPGYTVIATATRNGYGEGERLRFDYGALCS